METAGYIRPSSLEVAAGWVPGLEPQRPWTRTRQSVRDALVSILAPALAKGCFVAFSGGRDSSAVLALATHVARREGLPDPVPLTWRYPNAQGTDESRWQELVVNHLGIREWLQIAIDGENDLLGENAQRSLLKRGMLCPAPMHIVDSLLAHAAGGYLLTGEGGDEVLSKRRVAPLVNGLLSGKISGLTLRAGLKTALPRRIRYQRLRAQTSQQVPQPWLRAHVRDWLLDRIAVDDAAEPLRWDRSLVWVSRRRAAVVCTHNYRLVALQHDCTMLEPLRDERFLSALASHGGWKGFPSRTAAMRFLAGDLLPEEILTRNTKAYFNRAYMGAPTREFAESWNGSGVDHDLVDAERLREEWLSPEPSATTGLLLQQAWLAQQGERQAPRRG